MGVYKLSTAGGLKTPRTNYSSFLAGNPKIEFTSFDSIATVAVGSGGTSNISFTSIPQTYTHLQLRLFSKVSTSDSPQIFLNNDTTSTNYVSHIFLGSSATTYGLSYDAPYIYSMPSTSFCATVIDILDYTNTNKNTVLRGFTGYDTNTTGEIYYWSHLWKNTSAVSRIDLTPSSPRTWNQYTHAALYGIKGS